MFRPPLVNPSFTTSHRSSLQLLLESLAVFCVSGRGRVGLAGGGRGAADSSSSARSTLPETLQLLQPVADAWRHG